MGIPSRIDALLKRILLATDLSPRCDRALDGTARLGSLGSGGRTSSCCTYSNASTASRQRRAATSDPRGIARKQLCADIAAVGGRATMQIAEHDPAEGLARR